MNTMEEGASTSGDLTSSSFTEETAMSKDVLDIPPEILQTIFAYGTLEDQLNLRLTCRSFREQASHPSVLSLDMMDRKYSLHEFSILTQSMKQLMPNIVALHLTGDHSDFLFKEFLLDNCGRLETLFLESCEVKSGASIAQLPDTLSILTLSDVFFQTPESFFKVTGDQVIRNSLVELRIKRGCNVGSPAVFEGIATFKNLDILHLDGIEKLTDEGFVKFDGNLPNLAQLHLIDLAIGDQAFHTIGKSFRKLTELYARNLNVRDDGFVALKGNVLLERLIVEDCFITDASVGLVLDRLVNVKQLSFRDCSIEDRTMNAICQGLPHLEFLDIYANVPRITDMGIRNMIDHIHLDELNLVGVTLSDSGVMELVPRLPNLKKFYVLSCLISDLGFQAITEALHGLEMLILNDTIITNDGLARNLPSLTALQHVEIDSVNINESGVLPIIDFLSTIPMIDFMFMDETNEGGLHVHRMPPHNELKYKNLSSPAFVTRILPAFLDATSVSFTGITLTAADVEFINDCHPNMETLYMYDGRTTDDVAQGILSKFSLLKTLHMYNTCVTDATFLKLDDRCDETALHDLAIESDNFPSNDTIVTLAPILCSMEYFDVCTVDMKNQIILKQVNSKRLSLAGSSITDSILLAFVSGVKDLSELTIARTSVTLAGFREVSPFLTHLQKLVLDVSTSIDVQHLSADDAASVLGQLVASNLMELSIEGESFTDAGLAKLVPRFDTLKRLQVIRSSITLDCLKDMGPQLGKISKVVFRGHLHLLNAVVGGRILETDEEV